MTGLGTSAVQRRIEKQLGHHSLPVYLHKPTGKRYALIMEAGGTVELQDMQGYSTYTTSEKLANAEVWEKQA